MLRRLFHLSTAKGKDLYRVLGVPKAAKASDIKKAYLKLAKENHPDLNKSEGARERFAEIVKAYKTLENPITRAEYLLHVMLPGGKPSSETVNDADFIEEILELNEEIEQLTDPPALRKKLVQVEKEIGALLADVEEAISTRRNLAESQTNLDRIHYLNRSRRLINSRLGID